MVRKNAIAETLGSNALSTDQVKLSTAVAEDRFQVTGEGQPLTGQIARTAEVDSKLEIPLPGTRRLGALCLAAIGFGLFLAGPVALFPQSATLLSVQGYQGNFDTELNHPQGVAVDGQGNVFIADTDDNCVIEVPPFGGTPTPLTCDLSNPSGVAVDNWGNVFIADTGNDRVVEVPAGGGAEITISGGPWVPVGIAVDGAGNLFVADTPDQRVVEIPAGGGAQRTVASTSTFFSSFYPTAIAVDSHGTVFIADPNENVVQEVTADGQLGAMGNGWNHPSGVAVDRAGNVFIADTYNNRVLEVTPNGTQTTVATEFDQPMGIALDGIGNLYVADYLNNRVVDVQPNQISFGNANVCASGQASLPNCAQSLTLNVNLFSGISLHPVWPTVRVVTQGAQSQDFTVSGTSCVFLNRYGSDCAFTVTFAPKFTGLRQGALQVIEGPGDSVLLQVPLLGIGVGPQIAFNSAAQTTVTTSVNGPTAIAEDGSGNVYLVDTGNNRVLEMAAGGGAPITFDSELNYPLGVTVDGAGDVFIADYGDHRVVEIPSGGGPWTTVGTGLTGPSAVAVDALGNLFIADYSKGDVMELPAGGGSQQTILSGLVGPRGIAVDGRGNLYVVSDHTNMVEELTAAGSLLDIAAEIGLDKPCAIAVDGIGDLFIASDGNDQVLELPVGGAAISLGSGLNAPQGVAVDAAGNVFIGDTFNNRVLEVIRSQPPALTFVDTQLASTSTDSPQAATVQNIGNQQLDLTTVAYPADFPVDLAAIGDTELCANTTNLSSGQLCELPVSFTPLHVGILSESITIADNTLNATNATQSISLTGAGLALPAISLSATSLSYGSLIVGSASASHSVTLTNIGGSTLQITGIAVTGTDSSSFVFANTCGSSLAAGASCTIHGHFAPATAGAFTAAVTITDNRSNSPQSIALSGTGVEPPVTLSITSLSYGSVNVGKSSNSQSVTMTNTGSAALSITTIVVTGTNASSFVFANTCGTSLAVGASCTIHGHFAPTIAGALKAAVTISDSATGSPQTIALSGTGVASAAPVALSAISLSYPATTVGAASASQSVTMSNTGTAALTITSIAVTGAEASSFVFANSCGTSLAGGASCTIHGHFAPTTTGALTASITITDSAASSLQSIALSGTGH